MGIDVMWLDEPRGSAPILSLPETSWRKIEPAIRSLEDQTGVFVDAYGTTRLAPAHAAILLKALPGAEGAAEGLLAKLGRVLQEAADHDKWLLLDGD